MAVVPGVRESHVIAGTPIVLDPTGPLYTYLNGQGALRPYQQGTDDVGHAAISH